MPLYEYKCRTCGRIFELLVRSSDDDQVLKCEYCDGTDIKQLISRPAVIKTRSIKESGKLSSVEPRKAVEHMSRMYDSSNIDPGQGFRDVAQRAVAGDSPNELKEAIKEVRKKGTANDQ